MKPLALTEKENSSGSKYTSTPDTVKNIEKTDTDQGQEKTRFRQLNLAFDPIRVCRKIVIYFLWKTEHRFPPPREIWVSPRSEFRFLKNYDASWSDRLKGLFEGYSGEEWNWWPLDARGNSLASGKVRIEWRCVS